MYILYLLEHILWTLETTSYILIVSPSTFSNLADALIMWLYSMFVWEIILTHLLLLCCCCTAAGAWWQLDHLGDHTRGQRSVHLQGLQRPGGGAAHNAPARPRWSLGGYLNELSWFRMASSSDPHMLKLCQTCLGRCIVGSYQHKMAASNDTDIGCLDAVCSCDRMVLHGH